MSAQHTPGPWNWGKWVPIRHDVAPHKCTGEYRFEPESPDDFEPHIVLAAVEYGTVVEPDKHGNLPSVIDSLDFSCNDGSTVQVREADSLVIKAAPELLAALKWALTYVEIYQDGFDRETRDVGCLREQSNFDALCDAAKAAVKKATVQP